jgi:hypothetical protein
MSGKKFAVRWFDPRSGETSLAGEFLPGSGGSQSFVPTGDGDWVFILHDTALDLPVPNL